MGLCVKSSGYDYGVAEQRMCDQVVQTPLCTVSTRQKVSVKEAQLGVTQEMATADQVSSVQQSLEAILSACTGLMCMALNNLYVAHQLAPQLQPASVTIAAGAKGRVLHQQSYIQAHATCIW